MVIKLILPLDKLLVCVRLEIDLEESVKMDLSG